jgi:hypothetical protein
VLPVIKRTNFVLTYFHGDWLDSTHTTSRAGGVATEQLAGVISPPSGAALTVSVAYRASRFEPSLSPQRLCSG